MTWFGDLLKGAFKQFWSDFRDLTNRIIDEIFPDYFPFGQMQGFLTKLVNAVHDLTSPLFGALGQAIGDKTVERIDALITEARRLILQKAQEAIDTTKADLDHKIIDLDERVKKLEAQAGILEALYTEIIKGVEQ